MLRPTSTCWTVEVATTNCCLRCNHCQTIGPVAVLELSSYLLEKNSVTVTFPNTVALFYWQCLRRCYWMMALPTNGPVKCHSRRRYVTWQRQCPMMPISRGRICSVLRRRSDLSDSSDRYSKAGCCDGRVRNGSWLLRGNIHLGNSDRALKTTSLPPF